MLSASTMIESRGRSGVSGFIFTEGQIRRFLLAIKGEYFFDGRPSELGESTTGKNW